MQILFTIRTANRRPKHNYLGETLRSLLQQGVPVGQIHLVATDPDVRWMPIEAMSCQVHVPTAYRKPNANGLAQIDLLEEYPADWIIMTEDDLEWCADPVRSMAAWLHRYATLDRLVYRFFCFDPVTRVNAYCGETPLREQRGSQAVALRAEDARRFAEWARAHPKDWRPYGAPFQDRPDDGFDKLIGYWALQDQPSQKTGLVSRPFFVRHIGVQSAIHHHGARRDALFAGPRWRFPPEAA